MVKRRCVLDAQDKTAHGEQSVEGTEKVMELSLDVWHQATTSSPFGKNNVPTSSSSSLGV
jgi:hypothetical protein